MEPNNRNRIRFRRLFGDREISIDLITALSALFSTVVSIIALIVGMWQFSASIEKTDAQIKFLQDERIERQAENRPIVRVTDVSIDRSEYFWTFKCRLINDGKRQADSLIILNQVLAYDGSENLSDSYIVPMYDRQIIKGGGLFPQGSFPDTKTFERLDRDIYLVRIELTYTDVVSHLQYPAYYYFKIDLNQEQPEIKDYYGDQQHSDAHHHDEFHKIFNIYFP
jgi:hypothetical protein